MTNNFQRGMTRFFIVYLSLIAVALFAVWKGYPFDEFQAFAWVIFVVFFAIPLAVTFVILIAKWIIDGFQGR